MIEIDFPLHVDARGRTARTGHAEHVRDLVEQLLFTAPGERVNRPDFGCGLLDLVFAPNSPELAAAVRMTVEGAVQRWLGDLLGIESLTVTADDCLLRITLRYLLTAAGERRTEVVEGPVGP